MAINLHKDRLYRYKGRMYSMEEIERYFAPEDKKEAYCGYEGPDVSMLTPDFDSWPKTPPPSPPKEDRPPSITGALFYGGFTAFLWCGVSFLLGQPWGAAFSPFIFIALFFAFCSHEDEKSAWDKRQLDEIKAKLDKKDALAPRPTPLHDYSTEELKDEIDRRNQKPDPNIRAAF
jgi:hypothetical protein